MQKMRLKMRNLPSRDLQMPVLQQSVLGHRRENEPRGHGLPGGLGIRFQVLALFVREQRM
jgi:hypothetical protein